MVINMNEERIGTIEQIVQFLDASASIEFSASGDDSERYGHISRVLAARWIGLDAVAGRNLLLGTAAPSVLTVQYGSPAIDRWNLPNPKGEPSP